MGAFFQVGTTFVLRDIIRRLDNSQQALVVTSATKVLMSAPISVPDSHTAEGMQLLHSPPADKVPIATALTSPLKKKVSISGKIVQEDESRQVKVNGEEVAIKTVHVEDRSGKAKVTLWRSTATTPVRPGDHVIITDLVVNVYQSATSLSSTSKSTVEKCEAPLLVERMIVVEAVGVENGDAELFLDNEETMIVPDELLQQTLSIDGEPVDIEMAMTSGPLTLNVKNQGSDIISITKI